jgi:integrase
VRLKLTPAFVQKPPQAIIKLHLDSIRTEEPDRVVNEDPDRVVVWDTQDIGFGLMVTAKGHKSYVVQYRHDRRSCRMHLKSGLTLSDARKEAKGILGSVAKGGDPLAERRKAAAAGADTLRSIFEEYFRIELKMKRDAEERPVFPENGSKLRSARRRVAIVERLVYPMLGKVAIGEIRRSDLIRLLDKIAEENGEVMSDHVLAIVRKVMNWHASRSDEFRSPIVRGMARTKPSERARDRVLSDDELRTVWRAAEAHGGPWGAYLRFLLLTATRRDEARRMRRAELSNGDWLIPSSRYKTKRDMLVPLSAAAQSLLATVPAVGNGELVFTADGRRPIGGWLKRNFDPEVLATLREQDPEAKPLPRWTLHDLRRTARTLMSRAGIDDSIAERCLGHIPAGVRGTYDRHKYYDEKKLAFEKLATLVERIVNPKGNVLPLRKQRKSKE